mgnify:CR=1 FL=1
MGSLRDRFRRVTLRVEGFSRWQRAKYYVLAALLVMALFGVNWIGVAGLLAAYGDCIQCHPVDIDHVKGHFFLP